MSSQFLLSFVMCLGDVRNLFFCVGVNSRWDLEIAERGVNISEVRMSQLVSSKVAHDSTMN